MTDSLSVIESVPVIRDIFQAPIYVQHSKSIYSPPPPLEWTQKLPRLNNNKEPIIDEYGNTVYQFAHRKYMFSPSFKNEKEIFPLPTNVKSQILDAMLIHFASQGEEAIKKGIHKFRFVDILRVLGKHPKSKTQIIIDTIADYVNSKLTWVDTWDAFEANGVIYDSNQVTTSFSIIRTSSLFGDNKNTRIGRTEDSNKWHWVEYDKAIIERLLSKKAYIRYFMTDVIRILKPTSFTVYRYFFGFGDNANIMLSINQVKQAVAYRGNRMYIPMNSSTNSNPSRALIPI